VNKQQKQDRVESLRQELAGIDSIVIAQNNGITVEEMQNLRGEVRKSGGKVRVVKNTLARLSIQGTSLEVARDKLVGPVLIAFGKDPVGPAKALVKAAKDVPNLVVTGGAIQGRALDANAVKALSELPGRDELRSMFLGTLNAVPTKFVGTLAGVSTGLLNVLTQRKKQLEGA
jgi:large subunit ribosomal protein L10